MSAIPRKPSVKPGKTAQDFTTLVDAVRRVHEECAAAVNRTVNTTLTLRNWLIGAYIRDYEQNGADRAQYRVHLLEKLSDSLQECLDRCYTGRYLGLCRQFFDGLSVNSEITDFRIRHRPSAGDFRTILIANFGKISYKIASFVLF